MASTYRMKGKEKSLEELLVQSGLLVQKDASAAVQMARRNGVDISSVLSRKGFVGEKSVAEAICTHFALPFIELDQCYVPSELKLLLPADLQQEHDIVVLDKFDETISVATCRMPRHEILSKIKKSTGCEPQVFITTASAVKDALADLASSQPPPEEPPTAPTGAQPPSKPPRAASPDGVFDPNMIASEDEQGVRDAEHAVAASDRDHVAKEADELFAELQRDLERFTPKGSQPKKEKN